MQQLKDVLIHSMPKKGVAAFIAEPIQVPSRPNSLQIVSVVILPCATVNFIHLINFSDMSNSVVKD